MEIDSDTKLLTASLGVLPDEKRRFSISDCDVLTLSSFVAKAQPSSVCSELNVIDRRLVGSCPFAGRRVDQRNRASLFLFLLFVVMAHLLLITLLEQVPIGQDSVLNVTQFKQPQLHAYMYYASKIEAAETNVETVEHSDVKQDEGLLATKPAVEVHSPAKVVGQLSPKKAVVKEVLKVKSKEEASVVAAEAVAPNSVSQVTKSRANLGQSTQAYFQRQRERALDNLVIEESVRYTRKRSMSEMDGDLIPLDRTEHNRWADVETLDNELDPNRIAKKGHTCYRVVQTPTPLNPHA